MCAIVGGCDDGGMRFSEFEAITVSRIGSFELEMEPDDALLLFTAPGEELWVPGWDPVILSGDGYRKGTVFVTTNHGHTTYWLVSDYDADAKHARYVRVTPEADTGTVDVSIVPNGSGRSVVHVAYQLTGLSSAGNKKLQDAFSEADYAAMMEEWRALLVAEQDTIDRHFGR